MLVTAPPHTSNWSDAYHEEIQRRAQNYVLSVTALNTWLKSPREFLERYLIRIPAAKNRSASFGTVVHAILHAISRYVHEHGHIPEADVWHPVVRFRLNKEPLSDTEKDEFYEQICEKVQIYLDASGHHLDMPAESERYFGHPPVIVAGMPLK